jgi:bacterioferritin-associated ferredoxin
MTAENTKASVCCPEIGKLVGGVKRFDIGRGDILTIEYESVSSSIIEAPAPEACVAQMIQQNTTQREQVRSRPGMGFNCGQCQRHVTATIRRKHLS